MLALRHNLSRASSYVPCGCFFSLTLFELNYSEIQSAVTFTAIFHRTHKIVSIALFTVNGRGFLHKI